MATLVLFAHNLFKYFFSAFLRKLIYFAAQGRLLKIGEVFNYFLAYVNFDFKLRFQTNTFDLLVKEYWGSLRDTFLLRWRLLCLGLFHQLN